MLPFSSHKSFHKKPIESFPQSSILNFWGQKKEICSMRNRGKFQTPPKISRFLISIRGGDTQRYPKDPLLEWVAGGLFLKQLTLRESGKGRVKPYPQLYRVNTG